jgi:hypothetical protein
MKAIGIDEALSESRNIRQPELLNEAADIVKLFAEICKLDGHLIEIPNMKSYMGESLFIATRLVTDNVDERIRYLAVDVVAKRGEKFIPVGIKDYEIRNGVANGNKSRHDHFQEKSEVGDAIGSYWAIEQGLYVRDDDVLKYASNLYPGEFFRGMNEVRRMPGMITSDGGDEKGWNNPVYQNRGIAALMIAVSIVALRSIEVDSVKTVTLTPWAERTWRHHGMREGGTVPLDSIVQRPKAMSAIRDAFNIE